MNICDRFAPQNSEKEIIEFWESNDLDDESNKARKGGKNLFVPHPPVKTKDCLNWNDIYTNMIYDTFSRFKSMRNFNVRSGIGFDPMNNRTERMAFKDQDTLESLKTLDPEEKEELLGLAEEKSNEFLDNTREVLRNLGLWMMKEHDYRTDDEDFIDSIWWSISELMDENLLFKKKIPMKWCPSCKVSPAVTEKSTSVEGRDEALIKISLKSGKKRYFLTYLNDIWKYPSSLHLAVHPDQEYVIVKTKMSDGEVEQWVILKDNVDEILEMTHAEDYRIQNTINGKDLEGISYVFPLRDYIPDKTEKYGKMGDVVVSDKIMLDTTGIVPLVPYYDDVHWKVAEEKDLAKYNPLMMNGHFDSGPRKNKYSSLSAFESERVILDDLESKGVLLAQIEAQKDVQKCDNCKSKLIMFPKRELFFDAKQFEGEYEEKLEDINFLPSDKDVEFKEWQLTRDNIWGHPFPMWKCDCGETFVPSAISELEEYTNDEIEGHIRPSIMLDLELDCPECDEKMSWIGKTIDPSFIRSCSPWAQLGYPLDEKGFQSWWPGEFFIGGYDEEISLIDENLALSLSLFDEPSTNNLMVLGEVVSEVDHTDVESLVSSHGYDSLRVHLYSDKAPWERRRVTADDLKHMHPLIRVLKNIQKFFEEYVENSEIDLEEIKEKSFDKDILPAEEWALSKLGNVRRDLERAYSTCRFDEAIDALSGFILEDFAQSYFILGKSRLEEGTRVQQVTILKLFYVVLDTISKLILPISPFLAEDIYQGFKGEKKSVFMEDWPEELEGPYNEGVEGEMEQVKDIIDKIFQVKRKSDLPEKWPLQKIIYKAKNQKTIDLIEKFEDIVKKKAKVKEIQILYPDEEWENVIIKAEPKRDVIKKSYQHWVSKIATMLKKKSPGKIKEGMEKGSFEMGLEGQIVEIDPSMVKFKREMPEGYEEISLDDQDIYVDLRVTEEIWEEETVREIDLRVKSMREDLDSLKDEDEIDVSIHGGKDIRQAIEDNEEVLRKDTGIKDLSLTDEEIYDRQYILEWDVNGEAVEIGLDPLFKTEVIDYLSELSELDEEDALIFYEAGYSSVESLEQATVGDLSEIEDADEELGNKIVSSFEEEEIEEGEEVEEEEVEEEVEEEEKPKGEGKSLPEEFSKSSTYLIKEENSDRSFEIFHELHELLDTNESGLCVTRDYPDKIRKEYNLEDVDMIWLSNVDREDVIRPKSLEKLSLALENFLTKTGGVILFNGVEYLITNNEFRTVLHLIQSIKDQVAINDSIMMIPVNPDILEPNQLDQINGVVDETIDGGD